MRLLPIFIFLLTISNSFSQSLSIDRVKKLKAATVRVTIENSNSIGTGFFVSNDGLLFTCWHVIEPAIKKDANGNIIGFNNIYITINDTVKKEFGILLSFFKDSNLMRQALVYDFCVLIPNEKLSEKTAFLKLGNFDNTREGQETLTCGYPIGIPQKFISKGIISTKYVDTLELNTPYSKLKYNRTQALLDMTMNKGNSGGAILLLADKEENDEVIGIADFIINPIGGLAETLIKNFDSRTNIVKIGGIDPNQTFSDFTKLLSATSIGVSGCVSINHIKSVLGVK
jgi:hypothetical protein